ncbi:ABC transporter permease [Candidatus Aerophobetes bacterium]|uniref:ABC transporter permease n=1 Tax=Aerophobetes bacterium TaxID=2030807 RepID=A0A2A4YLI1_UNCAE|nr:MAG: ABC transporter permease [Candidatus Aerophobetes bacterium]
MSYFAQYFIKRLHFLNALGEYATLIGDVIYWTIRKPPPWSLLREQFYHIGVLSLPVVAMTGFSTGLVLAAQSFYQLSDKGLASATGIMVAKAMITELGPVLTAFMVTGRVGAAMCAELGTMQVTEQIDALITMAVTPNRYLVAPRFIAGTIMMPLLTVFSVIMGIFGGYLIAVYFFNMSPSSYFDPMPQYVTNFDFFVGVVKSFIFGIFIVTICCYRGMKTSGGAEGVGRATTNSVVICYTCILFSNFLITVGLNLVQEQITRWFI